MKNFISVTDVDHIDALINQALICKADPFAQKNIGVGKKIGLIFLNPSLRTRISTQIAAMNVGIETMVFNIDKEGWALEFEENAIMNGQTVEHIKDAAPVLGSYFDILCIRSFPLLKNKEEDYSERAIQSFIQYSGVPVVSLESGTLHPLQSFADLITIEENFTDQQRRPKVVLTWAPHVKTLPQCVANSFAQWMTTWKKADFVITHPEHYDLDEQFTRGATIIKNQQEALVNADFIYVKNWSTYQDYGKNSCTDAAWMLTPEHLKKTNNAKVMHCLPVRRNVELSDAILDSANSIVTQQASNRVWAAQAVLQEILKTI